MIVRGHAIRGPIGRAAPRTPHDRRVQEVARLATDAAEAALSDGGLDGAARERAGLCLGVRHGRAEFIARAMTQARTLGLRDYCEPISFANSISSAVTGRVAAACGLGGAMLLINTGELSGLDAIGAAHATLTARGGVMLAGGADSAEAIDVARRDRGLPAPASPPYAGAALILLAREDATEQTDRVRVAGCRSAVEDLSASVARALDEIGGGFADVERVIVCAGCGDALERLAMRCREQGIGVLSLCSDAGASTGAAGALACCMAVDAVERRSGARLAIAAGADTSGRAACVVFAGGL